MGWITDLLQELPLSAIQRERLSLEEQKYALLETKQANLEAENKTLRLDLEKAEIEIQNLKKLTEKSHSGHLDEVKEKILVLLASQDNYESNIAQNLGISTQVATFHLEELEDAGFIHRSLSMSGQVYPWQLAQEGRRYLVNHALIA